MKNQYTELLIVMLMALILIVCGIGLGMKIARAFDYPALDTDPFSPGNPYGQVVEPTDPCGGKQ